MNNGGNHESRLWAVLTKEHLVDLSQFHRGSFFDEVPLFSRESDLDFLREYGSDRANIILLGFASKFLKSVVSYEEHRTPYFAAITVWSSAETDRVVPNLFVWSGSVRQLQKKLVLDVVRTPFGKKVKRLVSMRNMQSQFKILEDTATDPGETRVFISFSHPPYESFVPLGRFCKTEIHAR